MSNEQPNKSFLTLDWLKNLKSNVNKELNTFQHINDKDEHNKTALCYAAEQGNIARIKYLKGIGAFEFILNEDYDSMLHIAARHGHLELTQYLLSSGSGDVHKKNIDSLTPLHIALKEGHIAIAELLISHGADINHTNALNNSILHYVAENGAIDGLNFLLKNNVIANIRNYAKDTPLEMAARCRHTACIEALLSYGCNTDTKNEYGQLTDFGLYQAEMNNIMLEAAKHGDIETIKHCISQGASISENAEPYFYNAFSNSHFECAEFFLKQGVVTNHDYRNSWLTSVSEEGNSRKLEFLLKNELIHDSSNLFQALNKAAEHGHPEIVSRLVDYIGDPDKIKSGGYTALKMAVTNGHLDCTKVLVEKGVDVHIKDDHGRTLLSYAAHKGHFESILYLAEKLNGLHDRSNFGKSKTSFLHIASRYGYIDCLQYALENNHLIEQKDCQGETALHYAIFHEQIASLKLLLENGADVNATDHLGRTALHCTPSEYADNQIFALDAATLLIENNVKIDALDKDNCTALFYAANNGYHDIVKLLVSHGANVNMPCTLHFEQQVTPDFDDDYDFYETEKCTIDGYTALHLYAEKDNVFMVKYLIEHGADPTLKNQYYKTALDLAQGKALEYLKAIETHDALDQLISSSDDRLMMSF